MSGRVISFLRRSTSRDWSTQELAEFYRVESALVQAGLHVVSDRGVTDEGDPWFVFCRAEDDEVIVHFARIGGRYLISAPAHGGDVTGYDFRALVRDLVEQHPVLRLARRDDKVVLHPSALLVMLVATILFKLGHVAAAAPAKPHDAHDDRAGMRVDVTGAEHSLGSVSQEAQQQAVVLSAIAFVMDPALGGTIPTVVVTAPAHDVLPATHAPLPFAATADGDVAVVVHGSGSEAPVVVPVSAPASQLADHGVLGHDIGSWQVQVVPLVSGSGGIGDAGTAGSSLASLLTTPGIAPAGSDLSPMVAFHGDLHTLPQDIADSLLTALGQNVPVVYSGTPPQELSAPLHDSIHTAAASLASSAHDVAGAVSGHGSTAAIVTISDSAPVTTSVTSDTSATTGTVGSGEGSVVATTVAPAGDVASGQAATPTLTTVLAIMQSFAQEVGSHLTVLVTGNSVIEYDSYAVGHTPADVSAVTYDFADGSQLSLVGLPAELHHATMA